MTLQVCGSVIVALRLWGRVGRRLHTCFHLPQPIQCRSGLLSFLLPPMLIYTISQPHPHQGHRADGTLRVPDPLIHTYSHCRLATLRLLN